MRREFHFSHKGFFLLAQAESWDGDLYQEHGPGGDQSAICMCFGWCYGISSKRPRLNKTDFQYLMENLRKENYSALKEYSGNYTIIALDKPSDKAWIITDTWTMRGFYYGFNSGTAVISSKAAAVANYLKKDIDGMSLISLLRGIKPPPGRTLFAGIHRATAGRALILDLSAGTVKTRSIRDLFQPPQHWTIRRSAEEMATVFSSVVSKAASHTSVLADLTGGNDSRLTAAVLNSGAMKRLTNAVTFRVVGESRHPDVIVAYEIAKKNGWDLRKASREGPFDGSPDYLRKLVLMLDGNGLPLSPILIRMWRDYNHFGPYKYLLGSIGGELDRGFFWPQEFLKMGRSTRVNFESLLKYRLYAGRDINLEKFLGRKMTYEENDSHILSPYRSIDKEFPGVLNVYKLDIIYIYKLACSISPDAWLSSPLYSVLLPYLTSEVTGVSLRIPWRFRAARRVHLMTIELLDPGMSQIPSDTGDPMLPLRLSTCPAHFMALARKALSRFSLRTAENTKKTNTVYPGEWIRKLGDTHSKIMNLLPPLPNNLTETGALMGYELERQLSAHLMLNELLAYYPGIRSEISYDSKGPELFAEMVCRLGL